MKLLEAYQALRHIDSDVKWSASRLIIHEFLKGKKLPPSAVAMAFNILNGRAFDPDAGLAVLDGLVAGELGDSPLVPSVRGDLLERAGLHARAGEAFAEAAARTRNESERAVLQHRAELNVARASTSS